MSVRTTKREDQITNTSVLEYSKKNIFAHDGHRIIERSLIKTCKYCDSGNIVKDGNRKTKKGKVPISKCNDCKRTFSTNYGFEKKQSNDGIITGALEMYFSGMSVRDISRQYRRMGIKIGNTRSFGRITKQYLDDCPRLSRA